VESSARRILGLDVGSRTIGVAVTDELGMAAHGVTTIDRKGTAKDVERVRELVREYSVERVIVGMPYEIDGEIGQRGSRVKVFADALAATGIAIELWDERFSTVEATEALLRGNVSRQKRKDVIDKMAAQVILTSWLNEHG
jgi:putative Holliday junction resolvase